MTDLKKLRVSLTKQGAHKILPVILANPTSDVIAATALLPKGQKVNTGHIRNILSAEANDVLPDIWQTAKVHSEETLRHLLLLAIVFSHHELIYAFAADDRTDGKGTVNRTDVANVKTFTNIRGEAVNLGQATHQTDAVEYDFSKMFLNNTLGGLAAQLFKLKLQKAGWDETNSVSDEAIRHGFHKVLSIDEAVFRKWMTSGSVAAFEVIENAEDAVAVVADVDEADRTAFVFVKGHTPSKEGKSKRSLPKEPAVANLKHNMLQNKLYEYLCVEHGADNVGTEVPQGIAGNSIDVVTLVGGKTTFYEIKTRASVRLCIREALPQLLEYAYWPNVSNCEELVIVSEAVVTKDASDYLRKLRVIFGLPVYYSQIDRETGALGKLS
jgi:hypothetical protein